MDTSETIELADLALTNGQQAEVKGGAVMVEYGLMIALANSSATSTPVKSNGTLQIGGHISVGEEGLGL